MDSKNRLHKRLSILLLEDSSLDAELVQTYLTEHSKYSFEMEIVDSKNAFLAAISSNQYDIILCDYDLPDIDGFVALKHAKSICPLIPFIIVSGTIGEITAVELLKQGATDYVLKDRLGRLTNSIERALKEAEEKNANFEMKEQMQLILDSTEEGIFGVDNNAICTFVNKQFLKITGYSKVDNIIGRSIHELIHHSYKDGSSYPQKSCDLYNAILEGKRIQIEEDTLWRKDGTAFSVEYSSNPQYKNGEIIGAVVSFRDSTERLEFRNSLIYMSTHDELTGLYNRRFFSEEYNKMDNQSHYPLGIMMIDLNGLKIINDAFGHKKGDITLKKVAAILKKSTRKKDIIARIGGDEFAIIFPNITEKEMEKIKKQMNIEASKENIENLKISLATGYEIKDSKEQGDLDKMLKEAENRMYRHKLVEGASVRNNAIKAILKTLTDKYTEERVHSVRVSQLSKELGIVLELKTDSLKELELAAMYHDIGKISIPDAILNKPGRLTKEEFEVMKTHPEISYQILRAADEYSDLAIHALHHHERWDGKGYPRGKKGEEIPLFSRIICVVDAFEAMTSVRVYKDKMSEKEAVEEIISCSGTQFDERIAKVFVTKVLHKEWKLT